MTKPKKKVSAKRKPRAKPKKQSRWSRLADWHKVMITILATAAVFSLGGKAINACSNAFRSIDDRWAHKDTFMERTQELDEDIKLVGARLDQKIKQDAIDWRWKQMQELLNQFGSFEKMPKWAREKYSGLQKEINDIKAGRMPAY